jgi:hypothetical protein
MESGCGVGQFLHHRMLTERGLLEQCGKQEAPGRPHPVPHHGAFPAAPWVSWIRKSSALAGHHGDDGAEKPAGPSRPSTPKDEMNNDYIGDRAIEGGDALTVLIIIIAYRSAAVLPVGVSVRLRLGAAS